MTQQTRDLISKVGGRGRIIVLGIVTTVTVCAYFFLADRLSLDSLAQQEMALRSFQQDHPYLVYIIAFCIYVGVTGLSIPGATALTLLYAWFFGFVPALILVSFASTAGATLAFLLSRYLFRDAIQIRFADKLKSFNAALDREGAFYLFTLRLIPAVPFFVINVVMGLTRLRVVTFWWVSQLGMFAGTCVYVYAGSSIPELEQLADPSQLRAADVNNGIELVRRVSKSSDDRIGRRIHGRMSSEDQNWVNQAAGQPELLTKAQTDRLIVILNSVLTDRGMALQSEWQHAYERLEQRTDAENRAAMKQLTQMNRTLLVDAFPSLIRPPQPIISLRLLGAFCLLGLFPIAMKRWIPYVKNRFSRG